MMNDNTALSPRQRLDNSRQAIVRQMGHDTATAVGHGGSNDEIDASASTWSLVKQTATSWWHGHPASLALDFAQPRMQRFAQEQPVKLLAISAGILGLMETLSGPVIAMILFIMPVIAIYRVEALARFRQGWVNGFILLTGSLAVSALVFSLLK